MLGGIRLWTLLVPGIENWKHSALVVNFHSCRDLALYSRHDLKQHGYALRNATLNSNITWHSRKKTPTKVKTKIGSNQKWYSISRSNPKNLDKRISQFTSYQFARHNLSKNSLQTSLDSGRVSTLDFLNTLALVVEVESRHGRDTVVSGNGSKLIDVNLVELDVGVGVAQLLQKGGDGLAGTAPCGEEVDDDGALGVCDLGLVLLRTIVQFLLTIFCVCLEFDVGVGLG